jgi:S1-C subfamily serine protease
MKKFVTGLLIGLMLMFSVNAFAKILFVESPKILFVNGKQVDKPVYILNDETYIPLNELSEAMDAQVKVTDKKINLDTSVLEKVAEKCKDSCVMIYAYMKNGTISQGSGFAYNGYIITAKHVIEGSNKVVFFKDGGGYSNGATIHHVDNHHDLAILKPSTSVPSVVLGDSDKLKDGNKLISITSPYGEVNCMDECIFSGTVQYTTWTGINLTESSTDGGSSGGAVFNVNGELVGMVLNGEGELTGAIPINNIIRTLELRTK